MTWDVPLENKGWGEAVKRFVHFFILAFFWEKWEEVAHGVLKKVQKTRRNCFTIAVRFSFVLTRDVHDKSYCGIWSFFLRVLP